MRRHGTTALGLPAAVAAVLADVVTVQEDHVGQPVKERELHGPRHGTVSAVMVQVEDPQREEQAHGSHAHAEHDVLSWNRKYIDTFYT